MGGPQGAHSRAQKRRCGGQQPCSGCWWSQSGHRCPHWPLAGLVNTNRPLDTQSPQNDNEGTPQTDRVTHSCIATLSPIDNHTQSYTRTCSVETHTTTDAETTDRARACGRTHTPHTHTHTHTNSYRHMAGPTWPSQTYSDRTTHAHSHSPGSVSPVSLCPPQ